MVGTAGTGGLGTNNYISQSGLNYIELNDTFYKRSVAKFAKSLHKRGKKIADASEGLHVSNKMCRDIRSLEPAGLKRGLRYNVRPLLRALGYRYVGLLAQLSPSFVASAENMRRLKNLGVQFRKVLKQEEENGRGRAPTCKLYVELRHSSWWRAWSSVAEAATFFRHAGIIVVNVVWVGKWNKLAKGLKPESLRDYEMAPAKTRVGHLWPPVNLASDIEPRRRAYVRLHGKEGKYAGWYVPRRLLRILMRRGLLQEGRGVLSFNNTMWGRKKPQRLRCRWKSSRDGCSVCNAIAVSEIEGVVPVFGRAG